MKPIYALEQHRIDQGMSHYYPEMYDDRVMEFIHGCREITFNELNTIPEGTPLKYVGSLASRHHEHDLSLVIVHKISTLGYTAALRVQVDQVIFDPKGRFPVGKIFAAGRDELYTLKTSRFPAAEPAQPVHA